MDHMTILQTAADYIAANISNLQDFNYVGVLPKIDKRYTMENVGFNITPTLGTALDSIEYDSQLSMGTAYPRMLMQVILALRDSGSDMASAMPLFHTHTQELETMLLAESRVVPFGISEIMTMRVLDLDTRNSFFSKIDKDRWAFYIAVYTVELQLSGL